MHRTKRALLARGVDARTADRLVADGWTLTRLQQSAVADLRKVGLVGQMLTAIRSGSRPPIPNDTLTKLLFANRFLCCVCREPGKPIIVHHIVEWAKSHNHDHSNLAVLCLDHHDAAHSAKQLSQNLDASTLRHCKREWEEFVKSFGSRAIIEASSLHYDSWNYFNHLRLLEVAAAVNLDLTKLSAFRRARSYRLTNEQGRLNPREPKLSYMYDGGEGMILYDFMKEAMERIISNLTIINISDDLDRGMLPQLLISGDYIFVQGAHTFKRQNKTRLGKGQISRGVRRAHGVEVEFIFDRWEATSSSSWGWLHGRQVVGSLVQVRNIERDNGIVRITGTVLGIASGFSGLKTREYSPPYGRYSWFDADSEETEEIVVQL